MSSMDDTKNGKGGKEKKETYGRKIEGTFTIVEIDPEFAKLLGLDGNKNSVQLSN